MVSGEGRLYSHCMNTLGPQCQPSENYLHFIVMNNTPTVITLTVFFFHDLSTFGFHQTLGIKTNATSLTCSVDFSKVKHYQEKNTWHVLKIHIHILLYILLNILE